MTFACGRQDVSRAVLVEVEGCSISHEADVRALCSTLLPAAEVAIPHIPPISIR